LTRRRIKLNRARSVAAMLPASRSVIHWYEFDTQTDQLFGTLHGRSLMICRK
jgi:hypothetical protein